MSARRFRTVKRLAFAWCSNAGHDDGWPDVSNPYYYRTVLIKEGSL